MIENNMLKKSSEKTYQGASLDKDYFNDHINVYLEEIGRIPLLSEEEEKQIALRCINGDKDALEILVNSNLRLVVKLAKKYLTYGLSLADLIEEGNIGLIIAANKYRLDYDTKFSSYAAFWIKECMMRSIANKGRNIRIPVNLYEKIVSFKKAYRKLEFNLKRCPTIEEVASFLNLSLEEARYLSTIQNDTLSINELLGEDNDQEREAFLASNHNSPEEIVESKSLEQDLKALLSSYLTKREIEIITLRFGLNGEEIRTLEDIGLMYNLTKERVRQIEKTALNKLKNSEDIKDYIVYTNHPDASLEYIKSYQEEYLIAKRTKTLSKYNRK